MSDTAPYVEDENFVPEPTAQYGTLDTSGTAGSAHAKVEEVTPVFAIAEQQNAVVAAKALDPDDDTVPASLVILPDSDRSYDDAVEAVQAKAAKAEESEISLLSNRQTPAQKQAAESGKEAKQAAIAQTADHGAAGGLDGSGTGHTEEPDDETSDDEKAKAEAAEKAKADEKAKAEAEAAEKAKTPAAKKTAAAQK